MFRSRILFGLLSLGLLAGQAVAAETSAAAAEPVRGSEAGGFVTLTAKVTAINHDTREVTLMTQQGEERTIVASDQVRNLAQVNVGDFLVVQYAERVATAIFPTPTGAVGSVVETTMSRAELGQKPHGTVTQKIELTGRIQSIDLEQRVVTIQGKEADLLIHVADDVDLSGLKVGDTVKAEYVEALAISVKSPDELGK